MSEHSSRRHMGYGAATRPVDEPAAPAPPARGRHASAGHRLITWPLAFLLIAATIVVGNLALLNAPIGDDYNRPYIHSGQMGEPVDGRTFVVTVQGVRGGRSLQQIFDPVYTDGIFLLIKVRLSAYDSEAAVAYQALVDRNGLIYEPPLRDFNSMEGHRLQPRIPVAAELLFEVPTTAARGGLTLRLSTYGFGTNSHQVVVDVPLRITEAQVSSWFGNTQPLRQMQPEITT